MTPARGILVDKGFWIALYTPRDKHNERARAMAEKIVERSTLLLPWPCLYETMNTRFMKNYQAIEGLNSIMGTSNVFRLPDESYRDAALEWVMKNSDKRPISLVDMVIRLIIADKDVQKRGLLTFNPGDFHDVCREHGVRMMY
jgi:predicted nucleic acid-binding protein